MLNQDRELEEGDLSKTLSKDDIKSEVIKLGLTYNLASTFTSFIGIEERDVPVMETMQQRVVNQHAIAALTSLAVDQYPYPSMDLSFLHSAPARMSQLEALVNESGRKR
jgi:hypothetical protein